MGRTRRKYPTICHPEAPHLAHGLCRACFQYFSKAKATGLTTQRLAKLQAIVAGHPKRKVLVAAEWQQKDNLRKLRSPDRYQKGRDKSLRDRYRITLAQYAQLLEEQDGTCAICQFAPDKKPLYVDHRHDNGVVRGLLCPRCNSMVSTIDECNRRPDLEIRLRAFSKRGSDRDSPPAPWKIVEERWGYCKSCDAPDQRLNSAGWCFQCFSAPVGLANVSEPDRNTPATPGSGNEHTESLGQVPEVGAP